MNKNHLALAFVLVFSLVLAACEFNGGVEQGRCVAYDEANRTVTVVVDTAIDQHNPHYSGKVDTFKLPEKDIDMGPAPIAGDLLMVETDKKQILYYNQADKKIETMPVTIISEEKGVTAKSLGSRTFPEINEQDRAITVYSARLGELITFRPDAEDAFNLPKSTWALGDEVRIAYRNDTRAQAIRFMNVSKTNIFTR
ncbi:MAG: DUF4881 domain-containing protein [Desulfovibrio sp.]|nr:DUF4881 domain-containing protein [Desulfovibrio sp.]